MEKLYDTHTHTPNLEFSQVSRKKTQTVAVFEIYEGLMFLIYALHHLNHMFHSFPFLIIKVCHRHVFRSFLSIEIMMQKQIQGIRFYEEHNQKI